MENIVSTNSIEKKIPYIIIGICCFLMLIRAFYGMDLSDESFYLAVTKRFSEGDRLFREEWFTTQLIGIILLPIYKLHNLIYGTQDGIILTVRICYVVFSGSIAYFLFYELKKQDEMNWRPALCAVLCYLIYVRANIPTLSYYSIGLGTFLLFLLLNGKKSGVAKTCSGVAFSITVLCMPYMVLYFFFLVLRDLKICIQKGNRRTDRSGFYIGVIFSGVVFLMYCFFTGDFNDIVGNLPFILRDPEHQETMVGSFVQFARFMTKIFYRFLFWPMVAEFILIGWWTWKCADNLQIMRILKCTAYILFFVQAVYLRTFFEGGIIISFFVLAVQIACLNKDWKITCIKKYLIPGLLFGMIWIIGSNVGQRVFNMGCLIADIWAMEVIWQDIDRTRGIVSCVKKMAPMWVVVVLLLIRMFDIYRDGSVECLTVPMKTGAWKGIYTTSQREKEYLEVMEILEKYTDEGNVIVVSGNQPWIYLESDAICGSFSVWNLTLSDVRNETYYKKYPDKIPNVIFLLDPQYGQYHAWQFTSHGSYWGDREEEQLEGWFLNLVEEKRYIEYKEECGVFYVR